MTLLCADIGNSHTVIGLLDEGGDAKVDSGGEAEADATGATEQLGEVSP